jgi:hypothetical protein
MTGMSKKYPRPLTAEQLASKCGPWLADYLVALQKALDKVGPGHPAYLTVLEQIRAVEATLRTGSHS